MHVIRLLDHLRQPNAWACIEASSFSSEEMWQVQLILKEGWPPNPKLFRRNLCFPTKRGEKKKKENEKGIDNERLGGGFWSCAGWDAWAHCNDAHRDSAKDAGFQS